MSELLAPKRTSGSSNAQALVRGLAVLSAFRSDKPSLGVSEIGRSIGLSRSTTHRYVATLLDLGYLQQDTATRQYRLGPQVLNLGFSAINSMEVREVATPHLRQLSLESGYTASMAILDGLDIIYIERCRSSRPEEPFIDLNVHIGSRLPAYCTAMGKVLLAYLPPDQQEATLSQIKFVRLGPNTVANREALAAELAQIRREGISIANEEITFGKRAIAAVVLSRDGSPAAAINLNLHGSLGPMEEMAARLGPQVLEAASRISAQLGYGSFSAR